MAELMLINPRRRRSKKGKMPAGLKRYWASKRRAKRTGGTVNLASYPHRKRNPAMAKKSKRRRAGGYTVGKSRIRRRKLNPSGRAFSMRGFMQNTLMPSTVGAAGALGIDLVLGFLPLPPAMKTGPMKTVIKIAGAAAIGVVAANFVKRETANQIAAGAITVALYDLIKGYALPLLPPAVQASIVSMGENDVLMEEYPELSYAGAGYTVGDGADPMNEYVGEDDGVGMYFENQ